MTEPRVSLLVPCRNAERYLPRLFENVTKQTRPFAEVLCYDDNSTDRTAEVARSLGARVIPPAGPSTGPAAPRNRLAAAASCEWIHFHDADDLISERYVEAVVQQAGDADCVFCDADWITEEGRELIIPWRYNQAELQPDPLSYVIRHPIGINNGTFRAEAFRRAGGLDESLRMWEDADLYIRLAGNGARLRHVPGVHTWSLRHTDSFSHNYVENWNWRLKALERYAAAYLTARNAVAAEAERAAGELLVLGDASAARRALALCAALGHPVPSGNALPVRLARAIFPASFLLKIRMRRRQRQR